MLFTSGYTGLYVVQRGLLDEGQEFIQKPILLDTLAQKVREMLHSCPRQSGAARQFSASYTYVRRCPLGAEDHTKSGGE
jgi:hypothetical protein